jgi:hypothetical protein
VEASKDQEDTVFQHQMKKYKCIHVNICGVNTIELDICISNRHDLINFLSFYFFTVNDFNQIFLFMPLFKNETINRKHFLFTIN